MFIALVRATAAALAPAPLAKVAIDNGHHRHDVGTLDLVVAAFLVSAVVYAVAPMPRHISSGGSVSEPSRTSA